jgi:hypothetical protein
MRVPDAAEKALVAATQSAQPNGGREYEPCKGASPRLARS